MTISVLRTLVIGKAAGAKPVLRWLSTQTQTNLDWSVDVTIPLAEVADELAAVAWSIRPSGAGERQLTTLSAAGTVITGQLTSGVPGRNYTNKLVVTGRSGDVWAWLIGQEVEPGPGAYPLPKAPNLDYGAPSTWTAAPDVPVPALIFDVAGNFPAWPFGLGVTGAGTPIPPPPPSPALIFDVANNFRAWPFGLGVTGSGTPTPGDVHVPSLDFRSGFNIGLWLEKLGQVIGSAEQQEAGPALIFNVADDFSAWPFGCRVDS